MRLSLDLLNTLRPDTSLPIDYRLQNRDTVKRMGTRLVYLRSSTDSLLLRPSPFLPRELVFHSLMTSTSSLSESSDPFFFPLPFFFLVGGRTAKEVDSDTETPDGEMNEAKLLCR